MTAREPGPAGFEATAPPDPKAAVRARQVAAIEQTYPRWRLEVLVCPDGVGERWTAVRHSALSDAQRAAGLRVYVATATASEMVTALAGQDAIIQLNGRALR